MKKIFRTVVTIGLFMTLCVSGVFAFDTAAASEDTVYHSSVSSAGAALRDQMEQRSSTISISYKTTDNITTQEAFSALTDGILEEALSHTGVPTEGDYLAWIWYDGKYTLSYEGVQGDIDLTLNYTFNYTTTAEEEAEMDRAVKALLDELDLGRRSDYEKIKAIYYICTNVVWDSDHYDDISTQSAYAALVKGSAAHLGFAPLMYRLALELGVDCRVISGKLEYQGASLTHLWNIVKLNGKKSTN